MGGKNQTSKTPAAKAAAGSGAQAAALQWFVVRAGRQLNHDGLLLVGGDQVELSADDAAPLIAMGIITPDEPAQE